MIIGGVSVGTTGVPFSMTIPAHRLLVDGVWEWVPVVPTGEVDAPGYTPGAITFDLLP